MNGLLCHVETFEATCTPANIMRNFNIHTHTHTHTYTHRKRASGTQALNKKSLKTRKKDTEKDHLDKEVALKSQPNKSNVETKYKNVE